ncbi:MAG: VanW family protein [Anaerolineae bacterium]
MTTKNPSNPYEIKRVPARQASSSPLLPWLIRLPLLGAAALILFVFVIAIFVAFHQLQYTDTIFPGVSAYGIDLSGMTRSEAMAALSARYTYGTDAVFTFRDGGKAWQKTAADLGVSFDPVKTVDEAMAVGRGQGLFGNLASQSQAWLNGMAIQPTIVFDQSKAIAILNQIGTEINQQVADATITVNGTQVITTASQIGRELDVPATVGTVRQVVLNLTTGAEIPLIVRESQPAIDDAETVATQLRTAISTPIQIYVENQQPGEPGPWEANGEFIAGMYTILRVDDADGKAHYELQTNVEPLKNFLSGLAQPLEVQPVNARFLFNDSTGQLDLIEESKNGRILNVDATVDAFKQALARGDNRRVALVFDQAVPTVNSTSTAAELGITENVVTATTFFYGSSLERRKNIQVAASRFHGLVIAPGEEFSFNKYLGDVSPESGFETGLVIFGDRTIQGVGGGVCQVSSTVFQAAFYAGFPITERYAHGYRVGYYESGSAVANGQQYNSGVGLDATVYSPIIDLKFVNDTPYYLLMESYYQPEKQSLTFKFYSTGTGRVVTKTGPTLSNSVPHGKPKYTESTDLKPGQTQQVDYAVDGVDVRVFRTITQNGQTIVSDEEFYSHYLPWSAQFLVAVGYAPKS